MVTHIVHLEDDHHLAKILRLALHNTRPDLALTQFTSGESLLDFLNRDPGPVNTFVLDIRVPGAMDGMEVAVHIRRLRPDADIVLTSAYNTPPRHVLTQLRADYVQKPWQVNTLVQRLVGAVPEPETAPASPATMGALTQAGQGGQAASSSRRAMTLKFSARFERVLRRSCALLQSNLRVPLVSLLLIEKETGQIASRVVHPDQWGVSLEEATLLPLVRMLTTPTQPVCIEDIRAAGVNLPAASGVPLAFAGLMFMIPDPRYYGVLCALDTRQRVWNTEASAALQQSTTLLAEVFKLRELFDDLIERNDELNAYSSVIAHDLKSPLSAIIAYADSLRFILGDAAKGKPLEFIEKILTASDRMSDMITHLLWMARLDRPLDTVHIIEIGPVIGSALRRLNHTIEKRGVTVEVAPNLPDALGHDVWVEEVFANLISNAVKYIGTDNPAPLVRITAQQIKHRVRYTIEDNGIGIAPENLQLLFKSFSRVQTSAPIEGTGLGLAIVQRIVSRLGGEVGVDSEPGVGSTFWFTLPAAKPQVE
jgi:signal transduction histidine kinase/ActR/RegA family two-component response regulator